MSTRITTIRICRAAMATRLMRNHLCCIGSTFGPGSVRWNRRSETIKVTTAAMGVNTQATKPGGRRPSRLEIINAKAMRFRIMASKIANGNCRRQFGPDTILNTSIAGRGPEMSGGRKDKARKTKACIEAPYSTISRIRSDKGQRPIIYLAAIGSIDTMRKIPYRIDLLINSA